MTTDQIQITPNHYPAFPSYLLVASFGFAEPCGKNQLLQTYPYTLVLTERILALKFLNVLRLAKKLKWIAVPNKIYQTDLINQLLSYSFYKT